MIVEFAARRLSGAYISIVDTGGIYSNRSTGSYSALLDVTSGLSSLRPTLNQVEAQPRSPRSPRRRKIFSVLHSSGEVNFAGYRALHEADAGWSRRLGERNVATTKEEKRPKEVGDAFDPEQAPQKSVVAANKKSDWP